ncbi:MAG: J domain-containing protein [Acidobacteria bacterium]|nr:J domain-containing protein [Acidobacteriota bacterium]
MDFYELLGVRKSAGTAEIRRAYQKLARQLHPDLNPGDPVAVDRFRAVSRAFEVLSDPQRRGEYDRGETPPPPVSSAPDVGFEGFDFTAEVRVEGVGLQEIFGSVVSGAIPQGQPQRGEDLEQATRISFEESLRGVRRQVHLVRQDHCPLCEGAGEVAFGPVPCPRCHGSGRVRASRGPMIFSRRCPDCGATGTVGRRACSRCRGEGRALQTESLDVQIPAGVADGSRIRVPGCGNAGRRGGPPGDLVLAVEVAPHPVFRRDGDDLHCEVPVTLAEAALGAHIDVPTPEGPVTIGIPAGTQNGQRFRLRKRGMPRPGEAGRGDLYIEARVVVPTVTDERGRELVLELARLNPQDPRQGLLERAKE